MNIVAIIEKKRDGHVLSKEEINFAIHGYVINKIKDYHMSALLMAIYFNGMSDDELYDLTKAMIESGSVLDLSILDGIRADKHSTGGVGDKTTLVLGPMLAACGIEFAKISGRGLSHTGGTLDKLESIPGFTTQIDKSSFIKQVKQIHIAIVGQSEDMVPADKKLYALRDVSGSVPSIPLIAASVISKKIAAGASIILIDVKYGDGAFMQTKEEAEELANVMIRLGKRFNRQISVEITNMNQPLGNAIGNALEVKEALACLHNQGPKDLEQLCITSCAHILCLANPELCYEDAWKQAKKSLLDRSALQCFYDMVNAQGGDVSVLKNHNIFVNAAYSVSIKATKDGYLNAISCRELGLVCCDLGAGRKKIDDEIDYKAGILLNKKCNDRIKAGEVICDLYASFPISEAIIEKAFSCFTIEATAAPIEPLIYKVL